MRPTYCVSASRYLPNEVVFDQEFTSRAKAVAAFHVLAAQYISEREIYIGLGLVTGKTEFSRSSTAMASKSRGAVHVELSTAFYGIRG